MVIKIKESYTTNNVSTVEIVYMRPIYMALPTTNYAWKVGDKQEKKTRI